MKRSRTVVLAAILLMAVSSVWAKEKVRAEEKAYPASGAASLEVEVPVGGVDVRAYDGAEVKVAMAVLCDREDADCRENAQRIILDSSTSGKALHLEVKGFPKHEGGISVELTISIPRGLDLSVSVGVGRCDVEGLSRDVKLEVGVGKATLTGKVSAVRSVKLDAGVGSAKLSVPGPSPKAQGFIGKSLSWSEGKGAARISVDVGVGDVKVDLD
ncbi:MAG: hypothetical protein WBS54_15690 [Acidobacteriota bacterium]